MIGKVMIGKSFSGCVRYVVQKHGARVLEAEGIRTDSVSAMVADFHLQRQLNPELGKAVGHIALSWSVHDREKLNAEVMAERAREYLERMGIKDTQYLVVEHRDREHPHLHIVYNRVDYHGKTIPDKLQRHRNARMCRKMTEHYGYYLAPGKAQVNRQQLTGADKTKYALHDAISSALGKATSWQELEALLRQKGISLHYKYKGGTEQVQGISFRQGEISFKGSAISRNFSYRGISKQLERNRQQEALSTPGTKLQPRHQESLAPVPEKISITDDFFPRRHSNLIPTQGQPEEPLTTGHFRKKKRRKKKRRHL